MKPKTILFYFSGHDQELAALETAINYAEKFNAWLEVWHVSPDPHTPLIPYAPFGMPLYDQLIGEIYKQNEEMKKNAVTHYLRMLKGRVIQHSDTPQIMPSSSFHSAVGNVGDVIGINGRMADLIIMTRPFSDVDKSALDASDVMFKSGKPVLIVPPGAKADLFNGRALVAWDGGTGAARAVTLSLPFLEDQVWILSEPEGKESNAILTSEMLASRLCRLGIEAEALPSGIQEASIPIAILNTALRIDAGMIVMGAYSHNPLREVIFGGVTDFMLKNAKIPLLMAH